MLGVLYSFRRCPYAMRARLALAYCLPQGALELREVVLKDKPQDMLAISPKGTVPVLKLNEGKVIEESLDIMFFALLQNPRLQDHLFPNAFQTDISELITLNDGEFKWTLDRYKYADRYEESQLYYREKGEIFLRLLEGRLSKHNNLMAEEATLADLAILPFIRQFAHVDKQWFQSSPYSNLKNWLENWLQSDVFNQIMFKYKQWSPESDNIMFP